MYLLIISLLLKIQLPNLCEMACSFSLKGGSEGETNSDGGRTTTAATTPEGSRVETDSKGGRTTTAVTTPDVGALRVGYDWTRSVPEVYA